jgi:hypothetical protein
VLRWIALGCALSIGLAFLVAVTPHALNGAQFAWFASFLLWPLAALRVERWLAARRLLALGVFAALALPSLGLLVGPLGYGAPVRLRVTAEERALYAKLAAIAEPGDAVFEPSMLKDVDRPSPIPFLAGLPVHLSLLSVVQSLPGRSATAASRSSSRSSSRTTWTRRAARSRRAARASWWCPRAGACAASRPGSRSRCASPRAWCTACRSRRPAAERDGTAACAHSQRWSCA